MFTHQVLFSRIKKAQLNNQELFIEFSLKLNAQSAYLDRCDVIVRLANKRQERQARKNKMALHKKKPGSKAPSIASSTKSKHASPHPFSEISSTVLILTRIYPMYNYLTECFSGKLASLNVVAPLTTLKNARLEPPFTQPCEVTQLNMANARTNAPMSRNL